MFDIPAQALSSALLTFSRQACVRALYSTDQLAGVAALAMRGPYTREGALSLLLAQSG